MGVQHDAEEGRTGPARSDYEWRGELAVWRRSRRAPSGVEDRANGLRQPRCEIHSATGSIEGRKCRKERPALRMRTSFLRQLTTPSPRRRRRRWLALKRTRPFSKWGRDRGTPVDRLYIREFLRETQATFEAECFEVRTPATRTGSAATASRSSRSLTSTRESQRYSRCRPHRAGLPSRTGALTASSSRKRSTMSRTLRP
jgi:hypothetical protein